MSYQQISTQVQRLEYGGNKLVCMICLLTTPVIKEKIFLLVVLICKLEIHTYNWAFFYPQTERCVGAKLFWNCKNWCVTAKIQSICSDIFLHRQTFELICSKHFYKLTHLNVFIMFFSYIQIWWYTGTVLWPYFDSIGVFIAALNPHLEDRARSKRSEMQ